MRKTTWILTLCLISVLFCFTASAQAVIPQLLGPLSALISFIPQILAFVGVAVITALVFARDTTKMFLYKIRDFLTVRRVIVSVVSLTVLVGLAILTFQLVDKGMPQKTVTTGTDKQPVDGENVSSVKAWATFRGNADRTGHIDDLPGPTHGTLDWVFKDKLARPVDFSSSPTIVGNRLYIGAAHGVFFSLRGATYCIDTDTQEVLWRHDSDIPIFSSPAVVAGRVYIGEGYHEDSGCRLRCLDAKTGDPIWSFKTTSHVESTPFISRGRLYFTAGADGIYCLDALAGEEIWHFPGVHADMSPLVKDDKVYFGTAYGDNSIYAVDAQDGSEIWSKRMPSAVWGTPSSYQDLIFFGVGDGTFSKSAPIPNGKVIAVNAESGDTVWQYEVGDAILSAIATHTEFVTFGCRDNFVYTLFATNGDLHWKTDLGAVVVSSPAITPDAVYAATDTGVIYCLDVNDGSIRWEYNADAIKHGLIFYSSPAIANGKLYIGSSDRFIFCVGGENKDLTVEDR